MKVLKNLSVAQQLSMGFGVALLVLVTQSVVGFMNAGRTLYMVSSDALQAMTSHSVSLEIQDALKDEELHLRRMSVQLDSDRIAQEARAAADAARRVEEALRQLRSPAVGFQDQALVQELVGLSSQATPLRDEVVALATALQTDQANSIFDEKLDALAQRQQDTAKALADRQKAHLDSTFTAISAQAMHDRVSTVVAVLVGGSIAALTGWLLYRSITRPLVVAVGVADRVAEGDLAVECRIGQTNELGALMQALDRMAYRMRAVIGEVRSASSATLAAASEIATGNLNLAVRTELQAAALESATRSMEDVAHSVGGNAELARQTQHQTREAAAVAAQGQEEVRRFIKTIEAIQKSSQQMSDIVSVIDSIAFQTNILALNAAVEAARAGEQGRGFAVVASEVRILAQRSSTAAKEIRDLILLNLQTVETGVSQATQVGDSMGQMVKSSNQVAQVVAEISTSTEQQFVSIAQVHVSIHAIDEGIRQNAVLVEEAAASAASLHGQAEVMDQILGHFRG